LIRLLCRALPSEMGLVCEVSGGIFGHTVWLMRYPPFFKGLYREERLVERVFDRVSRLIVRALKIIAE